jgi:two-component system alkaline phosphatase synthesis response regulator PhoP/two-component system response regulator VicR
MARTVLAVDDERAIVRLIQVNLERVGYRVLTASDGKEALDVVASEHPDLVVMDIMMPRMDGFEALNKLKKDPATRDLPVILLTARAQDRDVFYGYTNGAHCYLTKPFDPRELISFVDRVFNSEKTDAADSGRYQL